MIFSWNLLNLLRADKLHFEVLIAFWKQERRFQVHGFAASLLGAWPAFGKSAICYESAHKFCFLASWYSFVLFYSLLRSHSQPCFFHVFATSFCVSEIPCHFFSLGTLWMGSGSSYPVKYLLLWFRGFSRSSYPSTQGNWLAPCPGQSSVWPPLFVPLVTLPVCTLRRRSPTHPLLFKAVLRFYRLLPWDRLLFFLFFFLRNLYLCYLFIWLHRGLVAARGIFAAWCKWDLSAWSVSRSVMSYSSWPHGL